MALPVRKHVILQKFYVYDPGVTAGDEMGGARVRIDEDEKGNYVLGAPMAMKWWIDQGLVGSEPLDSLSDKAKKMLAQFTRGRSENPHDMPKRVPRYDRSMQSGAPSFTQRPASVLRMKRAAKAARQTKDNKGRSAPKKPEPKPQTFIGPAE